MSTYGIWLYNGTNGSITGLADIPTANTLDPDTYDYYQDDSHIIWEFRNQDSNGTTTYQYAIYDKTSNTITTETANIPNYLKLYYASAGQNIALRKFGSTGQAEEIWLYDPITNLATAAVTGFESTSYAIGDGTDLVFTGRNKVLSPVAPGLNPAPASDPNTGKETEATLPKQEPSETIEEGNNGSILNTGFGEKIAVSELLDPLRIKKIEISKTIVGTPQPDKITGTDDNEAISGGPDKDELIGENGSDAFIFETPNEFGKANADVVGDFNRREKDKIGVAKEVFQGVAEVTFQAVKGNSASRKASESRTAFIYDRQKGFLYFNQNEEEKGFGTGGLFAVLSGAPKLTGADIAIL